MSNAPIVEGDRYEIPWEISGDLTDVDTVRMVARRGGDDPIELEVTVTQEAAPAKGTHMLTGDLAVGFYALQLEAVNGDEKITYPMADPLCIVADIG